jgi:hypothetical protein
VREGGETVLDGLADKVLTGEIAPLEAASRLLATKRSS